MLRSSALPLEVKHSGRVEEVEEEEGQGSIEKILTRL